MGHFGGEGDAFTFTGKDPAGCVCKWSVDDQGSEGVTGAALAASEELLNDTVTRKSAQREGRFVVRGGMNRKKIFGKDKVMEWCREMD